MAKLCQYHQLFDGTYDFDHLLDFHEALDVEYENSVRQQKAIEYAHKKD